MSIIHHNVRIPGSRPFRPSSQKPKEPREQSWDSRFHLGKIPEYDATHDPNLKVSNLVKTRKKIRIIQQRPAKRVKRPQIAVDLAKCVSVKGLNKQPVIQKTMLSNLSQKLEEVWDSKSVPQHLRDLFMSAIENREIKEKTSLIIKETEASKRDKSETISLVKAVQKREKLLSYLQDFAEKFMSNPSNPIKNTCIENLITLRLSSLEVVEAVVAWRKRMSDLDVNLKNCEFLWEEVNYLKKMMSDFKALEKTEMGKLIDLWENDPFLMHCKADFGKAEVPLEVGSLKRLKEAEGVLRSDGMPEVRKAVPVPQTPGKLTESRSRVFLKEETKELALVAVIGNVEEQLYQYSLSVPDTIQESLGKVENVFSTATSLRYPAFLWAKIGAETVGLLSLNLENQKSMQKRLFISHISVLQIDLFDRFLDLILSHIWQNYDCIEVRVGIISKVTEQGKYEADKSIKQYFDSKGFRWKQMIYTVNQVPVQLLGLRRPDSIPVPSVKNSIFDDNLELAYACAVQVSTLSLPDITNHDSVNYCSLVGVSCAVKAIGHCSNGKIGEIIEKLKGVPPAFRFRKDLKLEVALKDLQGLNLDTRGIEELEDDMETSVSCSALGLSWVRYLPCCHGGIEYTKVCSGVVRMKTEGVEAYLVSTEDPQYSVFIVPGTMGARSFEGIRDLIKGISTDGEVEELWIPRFKLTETIQVAISGTKLSDEKSISQCKEFVRFNVGSGAHPIGGLAGLPADGAVVIKEEFVFAMIHHKVDEELDVPLFVVHVPVESFNN